MTTTQKDQIRKVQAVLLSIKNGTPKFFNIVQFENMGLIVCKKKWGVDSTGNKTDIGYTYHLTTKGNRILNTAV